VLAVVDALKLKRPVLVGHSVAGEELSSIGTRYSEKTAGLVYLDAGYAYAFYDAERGDMVIDRNSLEKDLTALTALLPPRERKAEVKELLDRSLPRFEKDLQELQKQLATVPDTAPVPPVTPTTAVSIAIMSGARKYAGVQCPVLAIYALPHRFGPAPKDHPETYEAMKAADIERTSAQAEAFATANPQAHVVRVPNADHYIFRSNEEDVVREMNTFLATLPE
jgi:non-heme chloroperoxidase